MSYVTAKSRVVDSFVGLLDKRGIPFQERKDIIPSDGTTVFTCSGMQFLKHRFSSPDLGRLSTLQSCIRTTDLDLIGDGSHLTYFEMLGNFSFGNNDYYSSVELWHELIVLLKINVTHVTVKTGRTDHKSFWTRLGYTVIETPDNTWSDGKIGGDCCELFVGNLEIGNLVNTLGHSTDVGFGLERLHMIVEKKSRIDETSLFDQSLDPIVRDHIRALNSMFKNGVKPGPKGREHICRRMLRRVLDTVEPQKVSFSSWLEPEKALREKKLREAKRCFRRFKSRDYEFWLETFGLFPEEIGLIHGKVTGEIIQ